MRVKGGIALAVAVLVTAIVPAAAQADDTPWLIGAAKVDTTPPAFDPAQDLQDFPEVDPGRQMSCPRTVYSGPRLWRFEEPYRDNNGNGEFDYPDPSNPGSGDQYCDYNHNGRWDGIFISGGNNHQAKSVHDPIDARAVAFSAGAGITTPPSMRGSSPRMRTATRSEARTVALPQASTVASSRASTVAPPRARTVA